MPGVRRREFIALLAVRSVSMTRDPVNGLTPNDGYLPETAPGMRVTKWKEQQHEP